MPLLIMPPLSAFCVLCPLPPSPLLHRRLNTILISRFLLDLQAAKSQDVRLDDSGPSSDTYFFSGRQTLGQVHTLTFNARILGSLGSTIDPQHVSTAPKGETMDAGSAGDPGNVESWELSDMKCAQLG